MMMRIDDHEAGFEDLLGALGQPLLPHRCLHRRHLRRSGRRLRLRGGGRYRRRTSQPGNGGQQRAPRYRCFGQQRGIMKGHGLGLRHGGSLPELVIT